MGKAALQKAIKIAGSQSRLAEMLGTSQSQVTYWLVRSKQGVPGRHVLKIEATLGIPRHELRPDLYPPMEGPAAS